MTVKAKRKDGRESNGRPFKFGEPTVKREFRLPESMDEKLLQLARSRGDDVSEVLRDAVTRELASDTIHASNPNETKEALKSALLELIPGLRTGTQLQSENDAASDIARKKGVSIEDAKKIKKGVEWAEGEEDRIKNGVKFFQPEFVDEDIISVPLLDKPPCGPWKESVSQSERFPIGKAIAAFVGYEAGDFFVQADGESMKEAGVPDGSLIMMRPLEKNGVKLAPTPGEIGLIEVTTKDGERYSTVKHWYQTPDGKPDLRDGAGRPFYPPSDAKEVNIVAVKRGLLSRG